MSVRIWSAACATATLTALMSSAAWGGAFELRESSASAQGLSQASSTAGAIDITHMSKNPAALSVVEGVENGFSASGIFVDAEGEIVDGDPLAQLLFLGEEADGGVNALVPASYLGYRVNDQLVVGLSLTSPFGLATRYDPEEQPFASMGSKSDLVTIVASPTVAYDVTPDISLGVSVNIMYALSELTREAAADSSGTLALTDGSDWAFSFAVGALWDITDETRVGVAYRHGYDLSLGGSYIVDPSIAGALGIQTATPLTGDGSGEASLPAILSFGIRQELTDDLTLHAEVQYTMWSVFDEVVLTLDDAAPSGDVVLAEENFYENSFFGALGVEYQADETLVLRTGVAYDDTPTVDEFRSVRVPDGNRIWASVGAGLQLTDDIHIDAAYTYITTLEPSEVSIPVGAAGTAEAEFTGDVHIFTVGGTYKF